MLALRRKISGNIGTHCGLAAPTLGIRYQYGFHHLPFRGICRPCTAGLFFNL
jgi:hypothetical protein